MTTATDIENKYKEIIRAGVRGNVRPFIENFIKIQTKTGPMAPLHFNQMQNTYWKAKSPADVVLKAGQMGSTTINQADILANAMLRPGFEGLIIAPTDTAGKLLFSITDVMYQSLPDGVAPPLLKDTEHTFVFDHGATTPGSRSTITVGSAESKFFGRGRPTHIALFTEAAFYDEAALRIRAGIVSRMPIGARWVDESTANGQAGEFYNKFTKAVENPQGIIKAHFFPWFMAKEYAIFRGSGDPGDIEITNLDEKEVWLKEAHGVTDDQLRWRRYKIEELGEDFFKQENPQTAEEAFLAIGGAVFDDSNAIDLHALHVSDPTPLDDVTDVWKNRLPGRSYMIGVDIASGETRDQDERPSDFQVAVVFDAVTLEQVARIRGRTIGHRDFARRIAVLHRAYNNALVVPERNLGQWGFTEMIREEHCYNIYLHYRDDRPRPTEGFTVSSSSKFPLITNFKELVSDPGGMTIHSAQLIRELRNYRWKPKQGLKAMGAAEGTNDDELMATAMIMDPRVRMQAYQYKPEGGDGTRPASQTRSVETVL